MPGKRTMKRRISALFLAIVMIISAIIVPDNQMVARAATYEKLNGSASMNNSFSFTTGINLSCGAAVFADTGAVVNGSTRAATPGGDIIKIPRGFSYYDGRVFDVYFKFVNLKISGVTRKWTFSVSGTGGNNYFVIYYGDTANERDVDFSIWIQDGDEKVSDVDLIAGSCYTAAIEGAKPWSDDGKVYTNIPSNSLVYDSAHGIWKPTVGTYDKPTYFILGHGKHEDGSINGGYYCSGGGAAEFVLGYLVYRVNFSVNGSGSLEFTSKNVAVNKQILMPKLTAENYDIGYWTTNKTVTLTDGTTHPAGSHLTKEQMEKIMVTSDLNCVATLVPHNWVYQKNEAGDTITMKCTNEICSVEVTPEVHIKAKDFMYSGETYHPNNISLGDGFDNLKKYSGYTSLSKNDVVYYTDAECTVMTTKENSGAATTGAAPVDIGKYYVKLAFGDRFVITSFDITKKANYDLEDLNNLSDETGQTTVKVEGNYDSVNNPSASAELDVHLNDQYDEVTLYKIADLNWDSKNSTYGDASWVDEVVAWNTSKGYVGEGYASPNAMLTLSPSLWSDYYQAMFPTTGESTLGLSPVTGVSNKPYTDYDSENDEYLVKIPNLSFGLYAVVARGSGSKKYNVTVVDVTPLKEHTGPLDSWYAYYVYHAYLKDTEVTIKKKINNKQRDTVAEQDIVDFSVIMDVPSYKDRVTIPVSDTVKNYTLYFEDSMSPAFDMIMDSIKVYGLYGPDNDRKTVDLTDLVSGENAKLFEYNVFCTSAYSGTKTQIVNAEALNSISYDGATADAGLVGQYYTKESGALYTITGPTTRDGINSGTTEKVYRIDFNVGALKQFKKENPTKPISQILVTYQARVTDKIQVNDENNYNTARIYYEKNSTGTNVGSKEDTVKAYTYGLTVVKRDGADKKPLQGAVFWLYEEVDTFVGSSWKGASEIPSYAEYSDYEVDLDDEVTAENKAAAVAVAENMYLTKRLKEINGEKEPSDEGYISEETFKDLDEYKALFEEGSDYYYYTYTYEEDEPMLLDNGVEIHKDDKVTRVFKRYIFANGKDNFISNGQETGNEITGLDANNYILVENAAPAGYNELAEDVLLAIRELSEDVAVQNYSGNLCAFVDLEGQINEDGVLKFDVLNYAGLVLPSTGGIGTLIFTIIGIVIMGLVMIYLLAQKRKSRLVEK